MSQPHEEGEQVSWATGTACAEMRLHEVATNAELPTALADPAACPGLFGTSPGEPRWPAFQNRLCSTSGRDTSSGLNYQQLGLLHKTGPTGLPPGSG